MEKVDFFARRGHFVDHLAPIWLALDEGVRGRFYVKEDLVEHAGIRGVEATVVRPIRPGLSPMEIWPEGKGPVVSAAYGDLEQCYKKHMWRPKILMEHGVGLTPGVAVDGAEVLHDGYAGGGGLRGKVSLTLATNEFIARKTLSRWPAARVVVVGTPKMDRWSPQSSVFSPQSSVFREKSGGQSLPVVCVSFHWDGKRVCPEAGNAFAYYRTVLPDLARCGKWRLVGHGHPKEMRRLRGEYGRMGIEVVEDFEEVLGVADVYVNDCSSTMYEFCCTGKPVVVLNAPWFRRDKDYGIRFWRWSDVGPNVERPQDLEGAIDAVLERDEWGGVRSDAVKDLYPHLGESASVAARAIETAMMNDEW